MAQQFLKDPDAVLDYYIDWGNWLGGDTITESEWTVPDGITAVSNTYTTTTTTVWLSGGTAGVQYNLTNHITTAGGREEDRTITIICEER